jgi:hypothetical protein
MTPAKRLIMMGFRPVNILNYNPTTWAEWTKTDGVVGDATGLEFTLNNTSIVSATLNTTFENNTKYLFLYEIVSNGLISSVLEIKSKRIVDSYPRIADASGGTGNKKIVFTTITSITNNQLIIGDGSLIDNGTKVKVTKLRAYKCPVGSQIAWDADNLTADQLNAKYPF